jgi:hypothetical protein
LGGLAKHFKANEVYQGRRCFEMQICSEAELEQKNICIQPLSCWPDFSIVSKVKDKNIVSMNKKVTQFHSFGE